MDEEGLWRHIRESCNPERKAGQSGTVKAARKYHKGSGFLKRSANKEERIAKGAQRQFRYFTTACLIYITFAGAPVACPFLPSQYSSHHNLIFFF